MTAVNFLGPYDTDKILSGVLKAIPVKRPNWFQSFFPEIAPTNKSTINFDQEYATKNVMGMFVSPKADVDPIKLPTFGHKELVFSYSKEAIDSDEFEELNSRQMGDQFGQVDVRKNKAARFIRKVALAEQRFENLFEYVASSIALYGGYKASSEKHPTVIYDFGRTVVTTAAQIHWDSSTKLDLVPSVNLTASAVTSPWGTTALPVIVTDGGAGYTQGQRTWTKTLVTAGTATPVKDLNLMVQTCNERATVKAIHMSSDAFDVFEFDVVSHYKDAADRTLYVTSPIELIVKPQLEIVKGLTFRRMWVFENGMSVPIYTYNGVYNTRDAGTETKYVGNGWVIVIPDSGGLKIHSRIMHPKANWDAQARWINYWMCDKTGAEEYEIHTNFIIGHTLIDALVAWKVI
jgi:hypothetical protein